ncbi:MAG: hypothetical protein M3O31_10900 [Acidobacteriota bacterium]|nr:hypothetical protein [Acidobacteriota bacterium]
MSGFLVFCKWLDHTSIGTAIRDSLWLFPVIETFHIFGIISLVGSTSILDLRLMGLTFRDEPVSKLAQRFLPWAWFGFIVQVVTGVLMFASEAAKMYGNWAFQVKMLLILAAGLNAIVFHSLAYKSVDKWDRDPVAPLSARIAGTFSILLWFGIVAMGRWIAYVV